MQTLKRFGLFWVDFVVGEDWLLAAAVVVGLLATWGLARAGFPAWLTLPVVALAGLVASVLRAQRAAGTTGRRTTEELSGDAQRRTAGRD
jgi:hypothetical protein